MRKLDVAVGQLQDAGYSDEDILWAGYTTDLLKEAGYTIDQLKHTGIQQLKAMGFTEDQSKHALEITERNMENADYDLLVNFAEVTLEIWRALQEQ